jgi:pyrrolysine biosynthesis protein PylD
MAEALAKKADIILMADDDRFVAIKVNAGYVSDNTEMTAKGFVAGLDLMTEGVESQEALVIGCGNLGRYSVKALLALGAQVSVCDIDCQVALGLQQEMQDQLQGIVTIDNDWRLASGEYRYVIDATPAADFIDMSMITPDTWVAVPGLPCGLSPEAQDKLSNRYLHDPLQIGVATMVLDAAAHDG